MPKDAFIELSQVDVKTGQVAICWLGQAGFLFKTQSGVILAVDPYLSDKCEEVFGFKRLSAKVADPAVFNPDLLICTHEHLDHLDEDSVPIIMKNLRTVLMGPEKVMEFCRSAGIDGNRTVPISVNETFNFKGIRITPVFADHGELSPDAVGLLMDFNGIRIYIGGDTAYRPEMMTTVIKAKPHIAILPINGAYGNLNSEEAARLARDVAAKITIPCHYWTFKEHGGNPSAFAEAMSETAPDSIARFMAQGETIILEIRV